MLKLDLSKIASFVPENYVADRQQALEKAASMLANHDGPGGDFTGWVYLPRDYDKEEFARIKAAAKKIKEEGGANDLLERLAADPAFASIRDRFDELVNPRDFIGRAPEQTEEFIANCVDPVLEAHAAEWQDVQADALNV